MKRALITGVCGQDGSYLADILLDRGYQVHGLYRHSSKINLGNIERHCTNPHLQLHQGDVTDALCLDRIVADVQPDEVFHMADQDNVDWSYKFPAYQMEITVKSVVNLLSSIARHRPCARTFVPCSSTMFGTSPAPQNESTPFNPRSPYACAKVAAYHIARMYRQNYFMYVNVGIMFNHDSERRNGNYLLHKICKAAVSGSRLELFDADQTVQIGYARDYMKVVADMMRLPESDDYVVAMAKTQTIESICNWAYDIAGKSQDNLKLTYSTVKRNEYRSLNLIGNSTKLINALYPNCPPFIHVMWGLLDDIVTKYRSQL